MFGDVRSITELVVIVEVGIDRFDGDANFGVT